MNPKSVDPQALYPALIAGILLVSPSVGIASQVPIVPADGIFVGAPKIYDDRSLQDMLNAMVAQLAATRFVNQSGIAQHIGALQGATLQQSQFGLSAMGLPSAGVASTATSGTPSSVLTTGSTANTTTGTSNSTTTTNTTVAPSGLTSIADTGGSTSTASGTNGSLVTTTPSSTLQIVTTTPSVTPTQPVVPSTPAFAPPTAYSTSASDVLNEQLQLSYEVANLQLLLGGALSDRFIRGTTALKRHTTVGFPISIDPPSDKRFKNAIAEVEVTVLNTARGIAEAPSVIAVLPREKTYNVASLTDKSTSIGGGVLTGVFSLGVSWLWGHKTYYMVQDQDTIALQRRPSQADGATFAWQFRPVLGEKTVRPGLRQTFAQIAFGDSMGQYSGCDGTVQIKVRWRSLDPKTRAAGEVLAESDGGRYPLSNFDLTPRALSVKVEDVGTGQVTVRIAGDFMPGTRVRLGSIFLDTTTPGFLLDPQGIRFTAPARLVAVSKPVLVSRDGTESEIIDRYAGLLSGEVPRDLPECARPQDPVAGDSNFSNPQQFIRIVNTTRYRYDDTQSIVDIELEKDPGHIEPEAGPLVVVAGDKLFGLADAPYWKRSDRHLQVIAPSDALAKNREVMVKRLFWGQYFEGRDILQPPLYSMSKLTLLTSGDVSVFAVIGSGMSKAKVTYPQPAPDLKLIDETTALLSLDKNQMKGLKQIVLRDGGGTLSVVKIPDAAKPPGDGTAKFDKPNSIAPTGAPIAVNITGTGLSQIKSVQFLNKPIPFRWVQTPGDDAADGASEAKQQLIVQLPAGAAAAEGTIPLDVTFEDKTPATRILITIKKPTPAKP